MAGVIILFTKKYAPKKLADILGNDEQREKIKQWILNWMHNKKKKALLIYGPPGIGKTAIAYALRDEFDLELIEMNASDFRNRDSIERVLASASSAGSLFERKKVLLIDDVDALQSVDRGGAGAIAKIIKENSCPIIATATNAWDKKIAAVRTECELMEFKKVSKSSIKTLLENIIEKEKMHINDEMLDRIAESGGDVRAAMNDLQGNISNTRDREKDIFERVRIIFKSKSYFDAKRAFDGDIDYNLLKLWVDENIPNEYEKEYDVANAYNSLSRADVFEGRIRNSYWIYLKYCIDLITGGIALAKKETYHKFTRYQFPKYLREMSRTVAVRAMLKSIGKKIGAKVHVNRKTALDYLPLIKELGKKNQEELILIYGFEEEEIAFIMERSLDDIKNGKK